MSSNKKIFNGKQYIEAVKQLKMIGIISTVILFIAALIIPINDYISVKSSFATGHIQSLPHVQSMITHNIYMVITFVLVTPLLTLCAWNFLTKRSSSDFEHSLPYTRQCTYVSRIAAIVTWQVIMIAVNEVVTLIAYTIIRSHVLIDYSELLHMYLVIFAANVLCMAAISIACMITGNLFSNVCVSGLILFFPQIIIATFSSAVSGCVPVMLQEHILPVFSYGNNLIIGILVGALRGAGVGLSDIISANAGIVYTLVVSCIYLILAGVLYVKRKSETAGKSASSKLLQTSIRIILGFIVIWVAGVITSIQKYVDHELSAGSAAYRIIIVFIVAAVVMIVYECISSKKISGIVRIIPSILLSYVIGTIAFFGLYGIININLNYTPSVNDITSVSFSKVDDMQLGSSSEEDYFSKCADDVKVENTTIKEILVDALNSNVRMIKNGSYFLSYVYNSNFLEYTVKFYEGSSVKYRRVYVSQEQFAKLSTEIESYVKTEEGKTFAESYRYLPDADECSIDVNSLDFNFKDIKNIKALYEQMKSEAEAMTFTEWYADVNTSIPDGTPYFNVSFLKDGHKYYMLIPIVKDRLPKTYLKVYNMVNQENFENIPDITDQIEKIINQSNEVAAGNSANSNSESSFGTSSSDLYISIYENGKYIKAFDTSLRPANLAVGKRNDVLEQLVSRMDAEKTSGKAADLDMNKAYVVIRYNTYGTLDSDMDYYDISNYKKRYYIVQLEGYDTMESYFSN